VVRKKHVALPPRALLAVLSCFQNNRDVAIGAEVMATGPAVRTFNVLLAEGRAVAAALIAVD
jgi:uncharacterized protein